MKINNAFELEEWRKNIGNMLNKSRFRDSKEGLIAYIQCYMPNTYKEIEKSLPVDINDLNWKQIAELIG